MQYDINGKVSVVTERSTTYLTVTNQNKSFSISSSDPSVRGFLRALEAKCKQHDAIDESETVNDGYGQVELSMPVETPPAKDRTWLQRMYALTTEYHRKTGKKVHIVDLLDDFFATSLQTIDEEDQPLFEARLVERMESCAPGWELV